MGPRTRFFAANRQNCHENQAEQVAVHRIRLGSGDDNPETPPAAAW